jgi:hypothetical protein
MKCPVTPVLLVLSLLLGTPDTLAQAQGWPRTFQQPSGKLVLFEPHVDSWDSGIVWRQAFQLTPAGKSMTLGAASFEGTTSTNTETHIITITGTQVTGTYFPGLDAAASPPLVTLLSSLVPPTFDMALERLVAYMRTPASMRQAPSAHSPLAILVSSSPAVLLRLKGQPVLTAVPKTRLKYVANTSWPLFEDSTNGHVYLLVNNLWLEANRLQGPWRLISRLPEDFRHLPADDRFAPVRKFVPPPPVRGATVPEVLYATSAAAVILFDGPPVFAPITGTQLERATNTRSPIFRLNPGSTYYYLVVGRWFSAPSLKGPWSDATSSLPTDFSNIPPDSPAGAVLAAVPGTTQAEDAALLSQVPKRPALSARQVSVTYLGTPQFAPVAGTTMQYATNTADKVLLIGAVYYLSRRGQWFIAPSPQGPWTTAPGAPEVIYTIPPSSPAYRRVRWIRRILGIRWMRGVRGVHDRLEDNPQRSGGLHTPGALPRAESRCLTRSSAHPLRMMSAACMFVTEFACCAKGC